jgi:pyridoxal biosynthesis lyase PdxS
VPQDEAGNGNVERAVRHLRQAIDELRDAQAHGQTGLALGFVLARDQRNTTVEAEPGQSSPRRTA